VGKYDPLRDHLASRAAATNEVRMTFADVEALIGPLPQSARVHRAWWANDSKVEAQAWRSAGWHVESVSLTAERVVFAAARWVDRTHAERNSAMGSVKALLQRPG
jgi:hypothetical protein